MTKNNEQETVSTEAAPKSADVKRLPRKKKKQVGRASKSGKTGG
ncbi:hypothetical protein C8P68_101728 [Mucilaginibacter yixingensis]|uniref:Uncharacterized protein n=1 Tax=Mucilaginibacter yixingensis TaxID=1295612 RepID=A0A2T5JGH7_9SPHI|nr:hypothetical protein [Mucilaginibacter yixingensis]PTR01494.1 hypothetical protein C8P68_101728 [Mucilaginibacter yixingensis]